MRKFTIHKNEYLNRPITGYYHTNYLRYKQPGNPDYLNDLKNTFDDYPKQKLERASQELYQVLKQDLQQFDRNLTISVVPRSKSIDSYSNKQLLFKLVVKQLIKELGFNDGTDHIIRHTDTKTTHLSRSGYGGNGDLPYPGITKDTCDVSSKVNGKNILLIDDIYTTNVNIDEDAIQTLLDYNAKSVIFYSVGKTIWIIQIML